VTPTLTDDEVALGLDGLPGWAGDTEAIAASYRFADFRTAIAFIVRLAFEAERLNHHPELTNVYATVGLRLTTHDAGGVTQYDLDLASAVATIAAQFGAT